MIMKTIPLDRIRNNPHRMLNINPLNNDRVQSLMESINNYGFWHGVIARPDPVDSGYYQLAFGHHRIEAARRVNYVEVEIDIVDLTEAAMVQYLSAENVNQGGKTPAAVYEVITEAYKLMEGYILKSDSYAQLLEMIGESCAAPGGGAGIKPQDWARIKNSAEDGVVGREILELLLGKTTYSNRDYDIGIGMVRSDRGVEKARENFVDVKTKAIESDDDEAYKAEQDKAQRDLVNAIKEQHYRDMQRSFPKVKNAETFIRILRKDEKKKRGKIFANLDDSEQIALANQIIKEETSVRDMEARMVEIIKGKKEAERIRKENEKEEKKRKEEAIKRRREEAKKRKERLMYGMTPGEYLAGMIGEFRNVSNALRKFAEIAEYIDDETMGILQDFCAEMHPSIEKLMVKEGKEIAVREGNIIDVEFNK